MAFFRICDILEFEILAAALAACSSSQYHVVVVVVVLVLELFKANLSFLGSLEFLMLLLGSLG